MTVRTMSDCIEQFGLNIEFIIDDLGTIFGESDVWIFNIEDISYIIRLA